MNGVWDVGETATLDYAPRSYGVTSHYAPLHAKVIHQLGRWTWCAHFGIGFVPEWAERFNGYSSTAEGARDAFIAALQGAIMRGDVRRVFVR